MFWMDNKAMMQKELNLAGIPVPRSFECSTEEQALTAFRQLRSPAIVKPTYGSRSRHTTVGITSEEQMIRAFHIAQEISQWVMVQEELPGFVHRVLWVGDQVVAVMRREPAFSIFLNLLSKIYFPHANFL
jgi:cyanophycin synthetase